MTETQIDALNDWSVLTDFTDAQRAALAYTDAMTREVHVSDGVFDVLRLHFNQQERVELSATIAGYNFVSRFLEALAVDPEAAHAQTRQRPA